MGCRGWSLAVTALVAGAAACGSIPGSSAGGQGAGAPGATASSPSSPPSLPATTGARATTVEADCGAGAYEPARLVVTCGQGTVVATEIHWSGWSAATATGTSVVMVDACVPRCAAVSARPYPARLVLTTPVDTAQGPRFSRLAIDWTGPEPYGRASDSYSLPTSAGPG